MAVENAVVFESTRKRKFFALKITSVPNPEKMKQDRVVAFSGWLREADGTMSKATMKADELLGLASSRLASEAWQATGTQRYEG